MEQLTIANVSKNLDNAIIEKIFKFKTNSDDKVKDIEITRAAPAGEGLTSVIYRINVIGKKHKLSFIAKGLIQDLLIRKSLNCENFFRREAKFFSEILPVLIETQNNLGAKESIQNIVPVCYGYYIDGNNDYILMEDLSAKGFTSISAHPSKSQRDMILKVLAHFHSVSFALRLTRPDVFKKITRQLNDVYYNNNNRDWYRKYLQIAIEIDKKVLLNTEGICEYYAKKIEKLMTEDIYEELIRLTSSQCDNPTVNHGDVWCPNFLCFKEETVVIDFQMLRCASPATDLSYFIILYSNLCTNKEDFYKAVIIYYNALEYYLKDMGLEANEVFSLDMLKEELKRFGKFGLLASLTTIPLMASEPADVQSFKMKYADTDKIPLDEMWKLSPLRSEEHKLQLLNTFRVAVDVGFI